MNLCDYYEKRTKIPSFARFIHRSVYSKLDRS